MPALIPCAIKAPIVVTIVGQPCRGKSLAAHKIERNLRWKGENVKGKFLNIVKSKFKRKTSIEFV